MTEEVLVKLSEIIGASRELKGIETNDFLQSLEGNFSFRLFAEALLNCKRFNLLPQFLWVMESFMFIQEIDQDHNIVYLAIQDPFIRFNMFHYSLYQRTISNLTSILQEEH